MKKNPLVYIILVNYNGIEDTIECIRSLKKISYDNYRIVVVENDSKDREIIQENNFIRENATLIVADRNNGFSEGNNIGIEFALKNESDYVLLLNNDTTVDPKFLNELIETAESEHDVGIVTGDIFFYDEPDTLWYSNGSYNSDSGVTKMVNPSNNDKSDVSFVCGCLMLLKTEMIKNIGMLDDSFFLYSEDTEYGCRAIKNNYRMVWNKKVRIYHKISRSTGNNSEFQLYYLIRNNLKVLSMYSDKKIYVLLRIIHYFKEVLRKRCTIKSIIYAYTDYRKGLYGKRSRFL